ncbi:hypothetical protein T11_15390, partial [Trichinella zimbabwensis]
LDEMLRGDVIEPSSSPWASPILWHPQLHSALSDAVSLFADLDATRVSWNQCTTYHQTIAPPWDADDTLAAEGVSLWIWRLSYRAVLVRPTFDTPHGSTDQNSIIILFSGCQWALGDYCVSIAAGQRVLCNSKWHSPLHQSISISTVSLRRHYLIECIAYGVDPISPTDSAYFFALRASERQPMKFYCEKVGGVGWGNQVYPGTPTCFMMPTLSNNPDSISVTADPLSPNILIFFPPTTPIRMRQFSSWTLVITVVH